MSDIRIVRRKSLAHVTGATDRGMLWIMDNIETGKIEIKFTIASELVDDIINTMKEDQLVVEVQ